MTYISVKAVCNGYLVSNLASKEYIFVEWDSVVEFMRQNPLEWRNDPGVR